MAESDNVQNPDAGTTPDAPVPAEGDYLAQVQALDARAASESDARQRAALLRQMAEIYAGPMQNPEMAFVTAARGLKDAPEDESLLNIAVTTAPLADAKDELLSLLEELEPYASGPGRIAMLRVLVAAHREAGDADRALAVSQTLLSLNPTDPEALASVVTGLQAANRDGDLLEVYRRQLLAMEGTPERVALLLQIAALQEEKLNDPAGAMATYGRLLELEPTHAAALQRLDPLCERAERWPELAEVLQRRITSTSGADARALTLRFANLLSQKLNEKPRAAALYAELLAGHPGDGEARAALAAIVQKDPQLRVASDALLNAYRATGEVAPLAALLESRVAVSKEPDERKALLAELAGVRAAQGDDELSYLAYWRAFKEDPNDAEVRAKLEQAAIKAQSFEELVEALEEAIPRIADSADAARVCMSAAALCETRLDEPERAVDFLLRARGLSATPNLETLAALDRILGKLNRREEQTQILEELAHASKPGPERVELWLRLGDAQLEYAKNSDAAAVAYEQALAADKTQLRAAKALEQIYEAAEKVEDLYRALEAQKGVAQGAERDRVVAKMAGLSSQDAGTLDRSIELYRELLAKNPRNEQAFSQLDQMLDRAGRYDDLKKLLAGRLSASIDPRELVRLNERLGRLTLERFNDPDGAITYFRAALDRDPRHRSALESLRAVLARQGKVDDLVIATRRLIPLQEDAQGVKKLRLELAEILAKSGRREEALDAGRRALEIEPHTIEQLDRARGVFTELKAWTDAARALDLKAQAAVAADDRETAIATLFEMSQFWRDTVKKPEAAGAALLKVLELDPANRSAYERALFQFESVKDYRSYAQVMDRYLPNLVTDEEKLAALKQLAAVQEQKLGAKSVAFLQWCRALELDPTDAHTRTEVERLAQDTGSYEELAAVYEEVLDRLGPSDVKTSMSLTLARVQDEQLDDADAAESTLKSLLAVDPTNDAALDRLGSMRSRRGQNDAYVAALDRKLEVATTIDQRKSTLREIARVEKEELRRPEKAIAALKKALELDPDAETLNALVDLHREQRQFPDVVEGLLRLRDLAASNEERAVHQVDIAHVYERDIGDDEAAIEAYRHAFDFDAANLGALEALERLYTKLDRPGDLLAVYERQLELTQDAKDRVKLLFKCASIWEDRYQNLGNADTCMEHVLAVDPQNLQAIKTLERLRRAQSRFEELVVVLEKHVQFAESSAEQAAIECELGDVFQGALNKADRAASSYHRALEFEPDCRPAMHALGTLYERSGNWPIALEMLEKEARVAGPGPDAVELFFRMGKINAEMLLDTAAAKKAYLEALALDEKYVPAIRALRSLYANENDAAAFEDALIREADATEEPTAKSAALIEVARHFAETKDDREKGREYFEAAIRLVPDSLEAARPLADIYVSQEEWELAERMLDIVTARLREQASSDDGVTRDLCRQHYRLGYVAEKRSNSKKALEQYEAAYQLDATYLPALEGYGHLLVGARRFDDALKVYQTILIHHRDDLTDLEVVEIYWTIGDIHMQLKQTDRAQNHFEKALGIDSRHEPTLRSMISIADGKQEWERSAELRRSLVEVLDGDEKFKAAVELGKLTREKLNDPFLAVDAYNVAATTRPEAIEVLDALYMAYRETKQGAKAAEVLERLLRLPAVMRDPPKAKRVLFALGEISRDDLKDTERAARAFNSALDVDPRFVDAFAALESMLGSSKQWRSLEDNYKRMIQRMPKSDDMHPARMAMWKALGDLYLNVLKHPDLAIEAYSVVAKNLPEDAAAQEAYANLALKQPGLEAQAVASFQRALPNTTNPGKVASALAELAARQKDYDTAYLAAQVVSGLIGEPGENEREILAKLSPYAKKREVAQKPLNDRLWQSHLFHPKVRGPVADIMAILYEQAGSLYKDDVVRYQINPRKHAIDVAAAPEYQIHHFRYVARVLGMEQTLVYSPFLAVTRERMAKKTTEPAPDPTLGVEICHTQPPCLRVGGRFFAETGQKEIFYMLGRAMAGLRPELVLATRVSSDRLETIFQAALAISGAKFRFTAEPVALETERRLLDKSLPEPAKAALARVAKEYVKRASANDIRHYLEGAELTAVRTGFFLAGEVEPVKKMVLAETGAVHRVQSRSKIRDMMVFALGGDMHALRLAVGNNVEIQLKK